MKGIAGLLMRQEIALAVTAERARCAAVCREVAEAHAAMIRWDDSPEEYKAEAAMECADAIEKGVGR